MRLNSLAVAVILSVIFLVPRASYADSITLSGVGGQSTDGDYVFPYLFTVTGPGGTDTLVDMSCLNFDREVSIGQSWNVTPVNVSSIAPSASIDGETGKDILADAYLYNQYAAATGNAQQTSDLQFAIWSIMDPTGVSGESGYDSNAQALAARALSVAPTLPAVTYASDEVFIPSDSYPNGGEPQIFMTNPPPPVISVTPEPASLLLLGTGLFGMVVIMRRKQAQAV